MGFRFIKSVPVLMELSFATDKADSRSVTATGPALGLALSNTRRLMLRTISANIPTGAETRRKEKVRRWKMISRLLAGTFTFNQSVGHIGSVWRALKQSKRKDAAIRRSWISTFKLKRT